MRTLRLILIGIGVLLPVAAFAQSAANGVIDTVGSGLPSFFGSTSFCSGSGACGFVQIAAGLIDRLRPLLTGMAVIIIVIAGYRMIIAQEEDAIAKGRAVISSTIAGLVMAYLVDPFVYAFYGSGGEVATSSPGSGATVLSAQVNGLLNWALVVIAALCILMIVLSALKSLGQSTSDEGIGGIRKTVVSVLAGLLLLAFRFILSGGFVETTGNPVPLIATALVPISFVMGFLALAAIIVVIYAGFLYVLSIGKEEQATKAKALLIRAAIGVVVIFVSLALVNFVMLPGLE